MIIKRVLLFILTLFLLTGLAFALLSEELIVVNQGDCFTLKMPLIDDVQQPQAEFQGQKNKFYQVDEEWQVIVGVPPELSPGIYSLFVFTDDTLIERKVRVIKKNFPKVSFWLKPAKKKLLADKDLIAEEWSIIEQVLLKENPEKFWADKFIFPVNGTVSMVFGTREYVNRQKRGQHRGLDLAVKTGTKVMAANAGKVVLVKKLSTFGGTMVIDHGQGINSLYFHLSKFLCQVGDEVGRGDIIALSGNTGISSGAHLHWGISVHDLRVNPEQWTREEL
jgi:murein DD-endopeptidase MepM/ murein hydrolase activator NlpD